MNREFMNNIVDRLYHRAPVALQNIFVSIYGYKLYRERYNQNAKQHLDCLQRSQYFTQAEMDKFVDEQFVSLAKIAIETVPFYRRWAKENRVSASDINGVADLPLFPIIKKSVLRRNPRDFVSDSAKDLIKLNTSGTTGSPLDIYCSRDDRTYHYAFFSRLRSWFGLAERSRRATFFGRIIMLPEHNKPPFWRMDLAQNNLLMSSYHLSENNLMCYYWKLESYRPEEIIAYPSSLYALGRFILQRNLDPLQCKVVITTAETLLAYQREVLEQAFRAPVIDQYGCTEMAFFVSQCEHGTMHSHPEHGLLETIGAEGKPVRNESGTLLATGLVNRSMPLIRYEVGDRVTLSSNLSDCPCGRAFPVMLGVEGRLDDVIYRKDGTPVGRLDPVFKGGSGIVSAKIKQNYEGNVKVWIVPTDAFGDKELAWLYRELEKRLGADLAITIELVQELGKESNGKFKAVESEFQPGAFQ
jgi:phenylacetate-coenzyme A ligase PaaK-like adenylate-forming protein